MKITEKIFDAYTNEETIVEREETTAEKNAREANLTEATERATITATKAAAKAALLERLGITAEEAQLLLGGN